MRIVCAGAVALHLWTTGVDAGQGVAAGVLAETRAALGGEAALRGVRALEMSGHASRSIGPMRVAAEFEIRLALPDRYVRVDRLELGGSRSEVVTGFIGEALVQRLDGPGGVAIDPTAGLAPEARAAAARTAVLGARQDLARWLLGVFGDSAGVYPSEISSAGVAESPDGRADVLAVDGPDGFHARLFIHAQTRLPLMVAWTAPDLLAAFRSQPVKGDTGALAGKPVADRLIEQLAEPVEHRVYFSDYRRVGRFQWPFRIRRSVGGDVVEDVMVDRFVINPDIDPRVFDPNR